MHLICCHISCGKTAEFEILDLADLRQDGSGITHACEEHVGALLGHSIDLPDDARDEWSVRPLD